MNSGRPRASLENSPIDQEFAHLDALSRERALTMAESLRLETLVGIIDRRPSSRQRKARARNAQPDEARA